MSQPEIAGRVATGMTRPGKRSSAIAPTGGGASVPLVHGCLLEFPTAC